MTTSFDVFWDLDGITMEGTVVRPDDDGPTLGPGQLFVVPRGVEHCPVADGEVHAILIEPTGVTNTGSAGGLLTATHDDSLA